MKISTLWYCFLQGLKNIKRNLLFSLATVGTIVACLFLFGMLGRENDVRYVGLHCYLIVSNLAHVYADKLDLFAGQLVELCQFHVRTKSLGELVLGKAYGQYEAIPFVLVEGLVEMERHALVGVGALLQIIQVVPVLIENQVAISCPACIEEAEVIEYRPLSFHRLLVILRSDFDTKSDSSTFFWHLYQHTVEVFVTAVEFLGSIVHILVFDM